MANWRISDSLLARAREPMRRDPKTGRQVAGTGRTQDDCDRANTASRAELVLGRAPPPENPEGER